MARSKKHKFSTGEKVFMGALAALAGFGAYKFATRETAPAAAGFDGSGDAGDDDLDVDPYASVVSTTSARAAAEQTRIAREEAQQARLAARTQRQREAQARAAASRAAREAVALEQRADTAERAARHAEALAAYDTSNIYNA